MKSLQDSGFLAGVVAGGAVAVLAGLGLALTRDPATAEAAGGLATESLAELGGWLHGNLGLSLPVFALVFGLYLASLKRLHAAVDENASMETVAQADHMADVWTSLFFGVGVIWTAIGMRGALVHALSGPASVDTGGAEVLARMVDGGILLALSTTIFGGVGGYLMRVYKSLKVGGKLRAYYQRETRRDMAAIRVSLSAIERRVTRRPDGEEA